MPMPPKYPCAFCGVPVPHPIAEFQKKIGRKPCCPDLGCQRRQLIDLKLVCCEKASTFSCVCESAYSCPVHAPEGQHIGSHD